MDTTSTTLPNFPVADFARWQSYLDACRAQIDACSAALGTLIATVQGNGAPAVTMAAAPGAGTGTAAPQTAATRIPAQQARTAGSVNTQTGQFTPARPNRSHKAKPKGHTQISEATRRKLSAAMRKRHAGQRAAKEATQVGGGQQPQAMGAAG